MDAAEREAFREQVTQVFAANLKRERKKAGLSQEKLGLEAGIDRTHVGYLERGKRTPELPTIRHLAEALKISSDLLVDRPAPATDHDDSEQRSP